MPSSEEECFLLFLDLTITNKHNSKLKAVIDDTINFICLNFDVVAPKDSPVTMTSPLRESDKKMWWGAWLVKMKKRVFDGK